jgi:GMP synthase (glutamine-hydrolysing)
VDKVLVLLHAESEGAGTLGSFLVVRPVRVKKIRLYGGEEIPRALDGLAAVVSMGGPMNVYEEERYPFLRQETQYLERVIRAGIPVLGICLGAQMIAKACGAAVRKAPVKEVGWDEISLTDAGRVDPLFSDLPDKFRVLQWHEDMFEVPKGGTLLATSEACPHQAFRYANAYGLQFHAEVTSQMLSTWFGAAEEGPEVLKEFDVVEDDLFDLATRLYANFWSLMRSGRRVVSAGRS